MLTPGFFIFAGAFAPTLQRVELAVNAGQGPVSYGKAVIRQDHGNELTPGRMLCFESVWYRRSCSVH
jgi:hypothetical protein